MKLILTIYFLAATFAFSGNLWFSSLEDNGKIEVSEHSTGCFHDTTSYYEITKSNGSYSFREFAITWDNRNPGEILTRKTIGTTALSEKDVVGLDGLLKYYRGKKDGSSTTQVSLLFEFYDQNGFVTPEKLHDGSGGDGSDHMKGVVTFFELTERFKKDGIESAGTSSGDNPSH